MKTESKSNAVNEKGGGCWVENAGPEVEIVRQKLLGSGHIKDSTVAASLCCHFIHLRTTMATSLWHLSFAPLSLFFHPHFAVLDAFVAR